MSTSLLYNFSTRSIQENQTSVYTLANQINSGKKFNTPEEDPVGIIGATHYQGRILNNDQAVKDREMAISDLTAQEAALDNVIDITNRIYEITIAAGNDSISADERNSYKDEIRSLGTSVIQLLNSKVGDKYSFSGKQSNLQTLRWQDGTSFDQAVYKHNQDDGEDRVVAGARASISLGNTLLGQADGAIMGNSIINPTANVASNIDFQVDDGNGNQISFTVNTTVGDDLATLITNINAAFNTAGGVGSVAQESPSGYLQMNTNLITGSAQNSTAKISVLSSSDSELTNAIGINRQDNYGREPGLLRTLTSLETALSSNDAPGIRSLVSDVQANLADLSSSRSEIGLLISQAERLNEAAESMDLKLRSDLSQAQDLDIIDATSRLNTMRLALQTAVQTTSNIFSLSLDSFIR